MKNSNYEIDMCNGPLLGKMISYSLPLMLSGMLQLLYNAADVIVVGRYEGSTALAAVGSTGSLTNLIISLFIGLSVGTSVAVAQHYGAGEWENVRQVVHTSIATGVISGIVVGAVGILMAERLLTAMGTPADVIDQSTLYMRIYFAGMPVSMIYNFGSSILRAVGDTKRPLIFLTISGIVNVLLNLAFVILFGMGVAGVALATVISQVISAVLVVICLMQYNGSCRLVLKEIKIYGDKLLRIVRVGIPAGIQSCIFSVSNVIIQSSVNSFGSAAMAGNSAASNIEGFIYIAMNSIHHTALAFTGQNYGARKYDRIKRVFGISMFLVSAVGIVTGFVAWRFGEPLLGFYAPGNEEVISYGMIRLVIISITYFTCGLMEVIVGMLRGMGTSTLPMIVSIIGVCGVRIAWIYTVFAQDRELRMLYFSYPVSWVATTVIHMVCYFIFIHRVSKRTLPVPEPQGL